MRSFYQEQRSVVWAMAVALVLTIVVLSAVVVLDRESAILPFASRLQSALRADLFVVIWLAAVIANVARLRLFSERDIAGSSSGAGSAQVQRARAILQNTFEQVGLAIVTHMIVAASFDHSEHLIFCLAILFSIGRLSFWIGYKHGAEGRAFGFALTFYPSLVALVASAAALLPR